MSCTSELIVAKERIILETLMEGKNQLDNRVNQLIEEIETQKLKLKHTESRYLNLYLVAIENNIKLTDLALICTDYLDEMICFKCKKLYFGSDCLNCLFCNPYAAITYKLKGKMKPHVCDYISRVVHCPCAKIYYCVAIDHQDVGMINYLKNYLNDIKESSRRVYGNIKIRDCDDGNVHLEIMHGDYLNINFNSIKLTKTNSDIDFDVISW